MSRIALPVLLALLAACATTGSTIRSGVGERQLEHPPYYAGAPETTLPPSSSIARFPVEFQRGATQAPQFDPSGPNLSALIADMNAFVDSLLGGSRLPSADGRDLVPPDVYFGCRIETTDCAEREESVLGRQGTTMRLAVARPSGRWIARSAMLLDSTRTSHALVITLEVGQYWPRQKGLAGAKSVELGTDHVASFPWLTSLETPVMVLQVTGALMNRDGLAVRIGAEGIMARRTSLIASALGAQRLITDADVGEARTLRLTDKPQQPLAWRYALINLLDQLSRAPE
jgi:hypothetical protein